MWKSDGSNSGTIKVAGLGDRSAYWLMSAGQQLFFVAADRMNGQELWKSDGTEAGTIRVRDFKDLQGSLVNVNGLLYFSASDDMSANQLWKSDGTTEGTVRVTNIRGGSRSSYINSLTSVDGRLFFSADDGTHGYELWSSDGTSAGTELVQDIRPLSEGSNLYNLKAVEGTLFFSAYDGTYGRELWKSDGTKAGTVLVKDVFPGDNAEGFPNGAYPSGLIDVNGILYFIASDGLSGKELWRSDGTEAGTFRVRDIRLGKESSYANGLTNVDGTLFFAANDGATGWELWKSDGTEAGTVRVRDINTGSNQYGPYGSNPGNLRSLGGILYFTAADTDSGYELWKSDGTREGTVRVKDIWAGTNSSNPRQLTELNALLYFSADDESGAGLWRSDGTELGTVRVKDVAIQSGRVNQLIAANGALYFSGNHGEDGAELWKSDGTEAGTALVKDIRTGGYGSYPGQLTMVGQTLYFTVAGSGRFSRNLWASDGTDAGTTKVSDINVSENIFYPTLNLTELNGALFFVASDVVHGSELWVIRPDPIPGDIDGDRDIDSNDLLAFLENWTGALEPGTGNNDQSTGDLDGDADVDSNDLLAFLGAWTGSQNTDLQRRPHVISIGDKREPESAQRYQQQSATDEPSSPKVIDEVFEHHIRLTS